MLIWILPFYHERTDFPRRKNCIVWKHVELDILIIWFLKLVFVFIFFSLTTHTEDVVSNKTNLTLPHFCVCSKSGICCSLVCPCLFYLYNIYLCRGLYQDVWTVQRAVYGPVTWFGPSHRQSIKLDAKKKNAVEYIK